jgi:hypothetical protein
LGAFFHGNPGGGGGDTRDAATDRNLQEFAARYHFGIIGVTWFPSGLVFRDQCKTFVDVLDDWAKMGKNPELANIPLIVRGSSNAGATAYDWVRFYPQRLICATPNVGGGYTPYPDSAASLQVPMLWHIGPYDPFSPLGLKLSAEAFRDLRPRGALWSWDAEEGKKHEIGHIDDIDMYYYDHMIRARLPADADPRRGPVKLVPLKQEDGWLADTDTWRGGWGAAAGATTIAAWADYKGDKAKAVWLPDQGTAILYRAIATYGNPLKLTLVDVAAVANAASSGTLLRSVGGRVVDPGTRLRVQCDASGLRDWQDIEFYDGNELLGTVKAGQPLECDFTVEPRHTVYALVAVAHTSRGQVRTSYPLHVLVRDPAVSAAIDKQLSTLAIVPPPRPEAGSGVTGTAPAEAPDANTLVSYALTAEQEKTFDAVAGQPAAFWSQLPAGVTLTSALIASNGPAAADAPAAAAQPLFTQRSAHSRAGVYFLFAAAAGTGSETDTLDFHLAHDSAATLNGATRHPDVFTCPQFSLALSEQQYGISFADAGKADAELLHNVPSPWHIDVRRDSLAALRQRGVIIRRVKTSASPLAIEMFFPWWFVAQPAAGTTEPPAGTRLGLVLGANSKLGERDISPRWPYGRDPWRGPSDAEINAGRGTYQSVWGDLLIAGFAK